MSVVRWEWSAGVLLAVFGLSCAVACSGDDAGGPSRTDGTGGIAGTGATVQGGGGESGTGGFSNPGTGGAMGTGGAVVPPPVFDSDAVPFERDDTAMSGLPSGTIDMLRNGTPAGSCQIIYPYEGTKFPGGLLAPLLMWQGGSEAAYVHVEYPNLTTVDYEFATGATNPGELRIPQDAWSEIVGRTEGYPLKVVLRTLNGGALQQCETTWTIAPGNMIGAIYYNTYNAPGAMSANNGAVMRLTLGRTQAEIYLEQQGGAAPVVGPCISCHSVASGGSTIVASTHNYTPLLQSFTVSSYDVTAAVQPAPKANPPNSNFGALTPDGARILTMGNPDCTAGSDTFPRSPNNFPLVEGHDVAKVLDTATGQEVAAQGLDPDHYMWMPQFSPSGDKVVFNHAKPDGNGGTDRSELAIATYDQATNTFGPPQVIMKSSVVPTLPYVANPSGSTPLAAGHAGCTQVVSSATGSFDPGMCDAPCYPAYPFFTPDGRAVIFSMISSPDFSTAFPGRDEPAKSELWYYDTVTTELVALDRANATLDPGDKQLDHYPTVLPIQVGGHYWVFWTSRRAWGHRKLGGDDPLLQGTWDPKRKRIWVAAIKPRVSSVEFEEPTGDPSFPGFYLEGQSDSGNVRAFATLNPCMQNGNACQTGLDCCGGFCAIEEGASEGVCTDEAECAKTNERCATDDDCCPPENEGEPQNICIAGYCGFVVLQ